MILGLITMDEWTREFNACLDRGPNSHCLPRAPIILNLAMAVPAVSQARTVTPEGPRANTVFVEHVALLDWLA